MIGIPRSTSNCSQKRVFHLFRPLISGKCSMHAASRGTTGHHRAHCQRSGAEHGDPGAHVSLFRRLVVPGTRSSTYATAEHLRIQYTGMSANSCHYLIHIRSILHVRQRSSIDEALLSEVPQPASCIIVLRTRSLTHDSLPESARRESLSLALPSPKWMHSALSTRTDPSKPSFSPGFLVLFLGYH